MKLNYRICPPKRLNHQEKQTMFELMSMNYDNSDFQRFSKDLDEKTAVILLEDEEKQIQGFSSYLIYGEREIHSRIIFSGDTIIHPDCWGSPMLFYGFGSILKKLMVEREPGQTIYWYLISKGYRTYYMLPLFFKEYWPQVNQGINKILKERLDYLSFKKFGDLNNAQTGVIEVQEDFLNHDLAEIPHHKLHDPHVAFFLGKNPQYTRGNELACLTEITQENIRPGALRFVK